MLKYTIKRILMVPLLLLLSGMLIFSLLSLSETDPVLMMLPNDYTQAEYDAMYIRPGLDKPVIVQYFNWVTNALQGDFGISYNTRSPVLQEVADRIPVSLTIAFVGTFAVILIGLPLGVLSAVKQYTFLDQLINVTSKIMGAVPGFWLGLMFILVFAQKLRWFPTFGFSTPAHWVLPIATLVLPFTANFIRQTRSAMLDCIRQDYVRTARSKGTTEGKVIFKHTLRNALLPILTIIGNNFAIIACGTVLIERVFAIPGIGLKIFDAISNKDMPVVLMTALFIAAVVAIMNLLVDLSYALVDPRIKSTFLKGKKKKARTA